MTLQAAHRGRNKDTEANSVGPGKADDVGSDQIVDGVLSQKLRELKWTDKKTKTM